MEGEILEEFLYAYVEKNGRLANSLEFAQENKLELQKLTGTLLSLEAREVLKLGVHSFKSYELTAEGKTYLENGSPEFELWKSVPKDGLPLAEAKSNKIAFQNAMKAKTLRVQKEEGKPPVVVRAKESVEDTARINLERVEENPDVKAHDAKVIKALTTRKLVQLTEKKAHSAEKGPGFGELKKLTADLTDDLLVNDAWKDERFKEYNLDALGLEPKCGALHPLQKVRQEFRSIFTEMGFEEMDTSRWVESSFWNFDALFQAQQHPARDMHDTFFVGDPSTTRELPPDYVARVKKMHESGGFGSIGYNYDWEEKESRKNILRTHTTAISANYLSKLAKEEFRPRKFFSIDRVFRNETLDATHLAEFHQIEGFVVDRNLSIGHLMGTIGLFFSKIGLHDIKFKPAYNPYTEPSMEIFAYHPTLKKWIEIGNSGIFRPEMLLPMGFPDDVRVIAWGLSLERPTMIMYDVKDIRELIGNRTLMNTVRGGEICHFDE